MPCDPEERAYLAKGWMHHLPLVAGSLLSALVNSGQTQSEAALSEATRHDMNRVGGWDTPYCHDDPYTEVEVAWRNAVWPEEADTRPLEVINAELDADREADRARIDAIATLYGRGTIRTSRDVLDLLVAAGVVHRDDSGKLYPVTAVPDPKWEAAALGEMPSSQRLGGGR